MIIPPLIFLVLIVAAIFGFTSYMRHLPPKNEKAAQRLEIAPGVHAEIIDPAEHPDAMALCSRCMQQFSLSQIHVVPTHIEGHGYVGSYRCDKDYKPSLDETRAYFQAHKSDDEAAALFDILLNRNVTKEQLRQYTSGKRSDAAVKDVLDAIEKGAIVLAP